MSDRNQRKLLEVMQLERACLLEGRLDDLQKLEAKKARLLQSVVQNRAGLTASQMKDLRDAAARNHRLYKAALLGIDTVREDVAKFLSQGRAEFKTYNDAGALAKLSGAKGDETRNQPSPSKLERRA